MRLSGRHALIEGMMVYVSGDKVAVPASQVLSLLLGLDRRRLVRCAVQVYTAWIVFVLYRRSCSPSTPNTVTFCVRFLLSTEFLSLSECRGLGDFLIWV